MEMRNYSNAKSAMRYSNKHKVLVDIADYIEAQNQKHTNARYVRLRTRQEVILNSTCTNTRVTTHITVNIAAKASQAEVNIDIMCYVILVNHPTYAKTVGEDFGRSVTWKSTARNIVVKTPQQGYKSAHIVWQCLKNLKIYRHTCMNTMMN